MTEEIKDINESTEDTSEEIKEEAKEEVAEQVKEVRPIVFEEALEAILFAAGHPISYATIARVFEMTPTEVKEKVMDYAEKYNTSQTPRGVILLTYADSCQLSTKKYYLNEIREALGIKKSGTLSTSSMEALAIVAYNQPVTRVFVDTLRRADSSYAMNNLLDRGLIESKGRLDAPGRPMLYGTTTDFLRAFGLKSISELPRTTEEIQEMFEKVNNSAMENEIIQESIEVSDPSAATDAEATAGDAVAEVANSSAETVTDTSYEDEQSAEDDVLNEDN